MHITFITLFPDLFASFLQTSLIKRAGENGILTFDSLNPRDFCTDKHRQVDDTLYGGGAGLLLKAQPVIDAVESVMTPDSRVVFLAPDKNIFNQIKAHELSVVNHLILICGRYEGIDYRFEQYMHDKYPGKYQRISLGQFVTLGGELPAMVLVEAVVRLIPGVIKEASSRQDESYSPAHGMANLEHPQYTKPEEVYGYKVPEVLVEGNHQKIEAWRKENEGKI